MSTDLRIIALQVAADKAAANAKTETVVTAAEAFLDFLTGGTGADKPASKPAAEKPKDKPKPETKEEPEDPFADEGAAGNDDDAPAITKDELTTLGGTYAQKFGVEEFIAHLNELGAKKISDLKESQYGELAEKLNAELDALG